MKILADDFRARWLGVIRAAAWMLLLLCLAGLLLEGALQVFAPSYRNHCFDAEFTGSQPIAMNSNGYRGPMVPVVRERGEIRVLGLGDSITFGTGVGAMDTWPLQIAQEYEGAGRVVAINAGMPATSIREATYAYATKWSEYRPDYVVLALSNNMVSLAWIRRNDEPRLPVNGFAGASSASALTRLNRLLHKACLPSFLSLNIEQSRYWLGLSNHPVDPVAPFGPMLAYGPFQGDLDPTLADRAWACAAEDLRALRDAVRERGSALLVAYVPARFRVSGSLLDNLKNVHTELHSISPEQRIAQLCSELGIEYVDAAAKLIRSRVEQTEGRCVYKPLYIPYDLSHLDRDGHRLVASKVAEKLRIPRR